MEKAGFETLMNEASAKYQTDKKDFCGVDTKMHEAFQQGAIWARHITVAEFKEVSNKLIDQAHWATMELLKFQKKGE